MPLHLTTIRERALSIMRHNPVQRDFSELWGFPENSRAEARGEPHAPAPCPVSAVQAPAGSSAGELPERFVADV